MSAQTANNEASSLDDVASVLTDLIRISSEISHLQEELISRGVPFAMVNSLVDRLKNESLASMTSLIDDALDSANSKLGEGAVERVMLTDYLEQLVELDDDLQHTRKISAGHGYDPRAINMLTQIIRTNPGDKGERVLNCLTDYARAYGIKIQGLQLVASNDLPKTKSVLPQIDIATKDSRGFQRYQTPLIELLLGCVVAFTAISLLT